MSRFLLGVAAAFSCFTAASSANAQFPSYSSIDPLDVPSPVGMAPSVSYGYNWQVDPFGVGYNLLSGYRPIYAGSRQPIGHEIIPTRPDGNGYVYRPVYAPSPGYRYTYGGALVIEYPQRHPTRADAEFPTLGGPTMYVAPTPVPAPIEPRTSGPRDF